MSSLPKAKTLKLKMVQPPAKSPAPAAAKAANADQPKARPKAPRKAAASRSSQPKKPPSRLSGGKGAAKAPKLRAIQPERPRGRPDKQAPRGRPDKQAQPAARPAPKADPGAAAGIHALTEKVKKYSPKAGSGEILKAYKYAEKAHEGQVRKGGAPYITHPLAVADILADLRMDQESLITALLHDVVEDTPRSLEDIKKEFGPAIAFLVDGVTKISKTDFRNIHQKQSENIRKMIVAMGKDVRVILVKLADRLHNLRTLGCLPPKKRARIANETLEVYAPLASRLGMGELKTEMEDLAFQRSNPETFRFLRKKMAEFNKDREIYTDKVIRILKNKTSKKRDMGMRSQRAE